MTFFVRIFQILGCCRPVHDHGRDIFSPSPIRCWCPSPSPCPYFLHAWLGFPHPQAEDPDEYDRLMAEEAAAEEAEKLVAGAT